MIRQLSVFVKIGIVRFVVISAIAGYLLAYRVEVPFDFFHFTLMILGVFFLSSGSLSLNQIQEAKVDAKMPRTKHRPVASGAMSFNYALSISTVLTITGLVLLAFCSWTSFFVGFFILLLYNGFYTLYWKKYWAFGAVPGAIPGALPCTIGYGAINPNIFNSESIYLFLIMFLWQMPHFWTLAIKLKDDYSQGGLPILPVVVGKQRTLYHISFYVCAYVLLALMTPFFTYSDTFYFFLVLPFAFLVLVSFFFYLNSSSPKAWLPFFLVTNFSMLAFIFSPVLDKWYLLLF